MDAHLGSFVIIALCQVCDLHGIPALVQLFSSDNRAVLRYATGATRNLIYENTDNKAALVDAGGVVRLVSILREPDEELQKTVTGIMLFGSFCVVRTLKMMKNKLFGSSYSMMSSSNLQTFPSACHQE